MPYTSSYPRGFRIRYATQQDLPALLNLIQELALYEKRPQAATASIEDLQLWLFQRYTAYALLGEWEGETVGYAIYYPVFSSFRGKGSLHVEDVFVRAKYRGRGFGKSMLAAIAREALSEGYACMYWSCLDWNQPSIHFYQSLGARQLNGALDFALDSAPMRQLARFVR